MLVPKRASRIAVVIIHFTGQFKMSLEGTVLCRIMLPAHPILVQNQPVHRCSGTDTGLRFTPQPISKRSALEKYTCKVAFPFAGGIPIWAKSRETILMLVTYVHTTLGTQSRCP